MLEHTAPSMMRMFEVLRGELVNYANSNNVIDQAGVEAAMADYESGAIGREVLTDAINRWRSGEPVE
jgi:hypothetical protein